MFSDHKPVSHSFLVDVEVQNERRLESLLDSIVREVQGKSSEAPSQLTLSTNSPSDPCSARKTNEGPSTPRGAYTSALYCKAQPQLELELEPEQVLQAFGEYWVDYVADENYGHLMQTVGQSFPEFLANLDQMHARVKLTFPNLQPPSFLVTDQTENSLRLHYYSTRQGLGPLIVGLLHGLGRRFDTSVKVESGREGEGSEAHDVFAVEFHSVVVDQS